MGQEKGRRRAGISQDGEENHFNLQECHNVTKELEKELELCKTDQNDIRSELQTLCDESKDSNNAMHNFFLQMEGCCNKVCYDEDVQNEVAQNEVMQNEEITNLKEQIALMEDENNSARLLLQMYNIDTLRMDQIERHNMKLCREKFKNEQLHLEAIRAYKSKLFKIEDEFAEQQSLWKASKETIETLKQEKHEMENNLRDFEKKANQKERNNLQMIQLLTEELSATKAQIEKLNDLNLHSEKELCESKKTVNHVTTRNEEAYCKMADALDLVEIAIKDIFVGLEREAKVMERNSELEVELAHSAEAHTAKMQEEIAKLKDVHKHDVKKYLLEIKKLKSKLEENETLLGQSERANSLMEVQLEKLHEHTKDLMEKSTTKILKNLPLKSNSDQTFKHADHEWNFCSNTCKFQHNSELKQLREEIINLKGNLAISNDKLQQIQQQNPNLKLDEERTEDMIKRCNHLESQLIEIRNGKKSLATKLESLKAIVHFEIDKRDHERRTLENKITELEMNLQKEMYTRENKSGTSTSPGQVFSQHCAVTINEATLVLRIENMDEKWRSLLNENLRKQEKSILKIKKLKDLIKKREDDNERWITQVKSSLGKVRKYYELYKEMRSKGKKQNEIIRTLKTKNDELQKSLCLTNESVSRKCTKNEKDTCTDDELLLNIYSTNIA